MVKQYTNLEKLIHGEEPINKICYYGCQRTDKIRLLEDRTMKFQVQMIILQMIGRAMDN